MTDELKPAPARAVPGDLIALSTDSGWFLCRVLEVTQQGRCREAEGADGRRRRIGPRDDVLVAASRNQISARFVDWRMAPQGAADVDELRGWLAGA